MKNFKYILMTLIIASVSIFGQQKELTIKQVTIEARSLYPKHLAQLQWRPGEDAFTYVEYNKGGELIRVDAKSGSKRTILTLSQLKDKFTDLNFSPLQGFPTVEWIDKDNIQFWNGDSLYEYNFINSSLKLLNYVTRDAENMDISSNNSIAYTIKNNLYIAVNKKQYQVTNDKNEGILNGQYVARNEFGIFKGTFWSPKSHYLAFYRKDQTMVTDYPIVNINYRPAKVENIKYPMAGMTSEQVKLGIYNLKENETVFLKTGQPKDHYLTGVAWDPNEKYVYIGILNRDQNDLFEIKYDISNGNPVDTLFEESNPKYVQPLNRPNFVKNHPDEFIWISRRDGWNHLYLYNTNGRLLKKLTKGDWEVTKLNGFDSNGNNAFFTCTKQSPLDRDYYMVNLKSGKITRLTNIPGAHNVIKDESGKIFLDSYSSLTVPYNINLINRKGKVLRKVFSAEDPLKKYSLGKTKFFKLKSKDGFDLYCREILPANFDSTKKYPALVYVYGGPGVQLITNRWLGGASLWLNYMAEHGYVVFTLDNRGSANRGLAFEQVTFRHLGTHEIEDQTLGAYYLKSLPYVDSTRTGVFGWSFGGFMTTSLMTRRPGLFKVAVAGGSVINWEYYEVMYTERYMDTPQANPEGYEESNLLNYAKNLKGKLLMIHGTSDPIVVWQHDLMFIKKCEDLGIPVDYMVYPGQEHGVRGIDTYHLYNKITNYFKDNL
jgi:dipeptidyl-peptidase 4